MELQLNKKNPDKGFFKIRIMSIGNYLKETKTELSHVNWPTKRQSIIFSLVVIIISVVLALFLGLFDFIFSRILNLFI